MDRVARATVHFPVGGQGVLVPGHLILTAAHVIDWDHTGRMALGDDEAFIQPIETSGRRFLVYPLAVEPVADLAILGAVDGQLLPEAEEAFEQFCEATTPVRLATTEYPFDTPIPAHVLAHTGRWIAGRAAQMRPDSATLALTTDEAIQPGTSGSPVVTEDGRLLGVVSSGSHDSSIPRPHLAAPVWLARRMTWRRRRLATYYEAALRARMSPRTEA
jgi:S1-C subfamily serine protease